jgi:hypothetical protein
MGKTQDLSAFELGVVVSARSTGLCQELQRSTWDYGRWYTVLLSAHIKAAISG